MAINITSNPFRKILEKKIAKESTLSKRGECYCITMLLYNVAPDVN